MMITGSCMIKREVVEIDPTEQNERATLNFGHTLGHAIEKLKCLTMLHGHCVALGALAAMEISLAEFFDGLRPFSIFEHSFGKCPSLRSVNVEWHG